ncbi:MAG: hypothetical protein FWB91_09220 [Defluviitaleaceae bacterium]|nr:hypothetical protein [Defluviitaleaceae bacterium]
MPVQYMKKRLWVIIAVLFIILAAMIFAFFYESQPEEREFRGTFIRSLDIYGHLHQACEESKPIEHA